MSNALHMDPLLPTLVGVAFAMLLTGLLLRRFRQPHVVAYLAGGVLLGPHGLAVLSDDAAVSRLGEIGVVLLLFFVGMEISLPSLARIWRVALGGTALQVLASLAAVATVGAWLDWPAARIVLVGFAISLSSTAVVISVLRANGQLDSPHGRDAVAILLAQDLAVIPMLVILGTLAGEAPSPATIVRQLVGAAFITAVIWRAVRQGGFTLPRGGQLREDHELQVFAGFLICFGFAWVTGMLGLSTALGAFVAGVLVSASRETEWVHRSLEPFRVLFVALFFVSVGMLIDLEFLRAQWPLLAWLVATTLVLNTLINAVVLRVFGRSLAGCLVVGAMLAQVGEFSFVIAAVGRQAGIVSEFAYQAILALIAITLVLSPAWITLVTLATRGRGTWAEPRVGRAPPGPRGPRRRATARLR